MIKIGRELTSLLALIFLISPGYVDRGSAEVSQKTEAEEAIAFERELAVESANLLERQMMEPLNKRIPESLRRQAKCIAVFPKVVKAGAIVAAKRGHGLVSCRDTHSGEWGAPAFFNITGASVGIQAGIKVASYVFLFMNNKAVDGLLSEKVAFGSDISMAAGPVGAGANVSRQPAVVTYVRTEGLFAGVDLEGVKLTFAKANGHFYGWDDAKEILLANRAIPKSINVFHEMLTKFAPKS